MRPLPLNGPLFDAALEVYAAAFALPPYNEPARAADVRARIRTVHGVRDGFSALCAVAGGAVVGVTYGYTSRPGQWWHDFVSAALPGAELPLDGAFEVVELAVDPACQGRGIGRTLLETQLANRPEPFAALSTRCDSTAHQLYRRMGFREVGTVIFPTNPHPFYIMLKALA